MKGIFVAWYMLQRAVIREKVALSGGGLWIFMLQFRRPSFCILHNLWDALEFIARGDRRWFSPRSCWPWS